PAAHADPTAHQRAEHGEETPAVALDGRDVGALLVDVGVAVEQHVAPDPHLVEADHAVVDTGQPALGAVVLDGDTGQHPARLVADGHEDAVHAVAHPV